MKSQTSHTSHLIHAMLAAIGSAVFSGRSSPQFRGPTQARGAKASPTASIGFKAITNPDKKPSKRDKHRAAVAARKAANPGARRGCY